MNNTILNVPQDKKNMAAIIHAAGLLFGFIPSLIMYLVKQDDPYLKKQSMEALNYQITVMILILTSSVLVFAVIGLFLLPIVGITNFVLCIVAAVKVSGGADYHYPFTLRLLKEDSNATTQIKSQPYSALSDSVSISNKRSFCGGCGQAMEIEDIFCPGCGSK